MLPIERFHEVLHICQRRVRKWALQAQRHTCTAQKHLLEQHQQRAATCSQHWGCNGRSSAHLLERPQGTQP